MKLFKEFKEFAVKGSMVDMAIGIIIGAAFNKVVDVLAKQIILPPILLFTDTINLKQQKIILRDAVINAKGDTIEQELAIAYGALFEVLLDFFIIGITVFVIVKFMNNLKRKSHDTADSSVETPKDIELLAQMNTLMEEQNALLKAQKK